MAGRHQHVRDEQGEVLEALLGGLIDGHRGGRGGGLEADAEEDDLFGRVLLCELHGVQRRIDDADIPASGLDGEQVGRAARHAEHVAERAEDHLGPGGDFQRLVNQLDRRDADRAAGAVDERDLPGQQLVEAEFDDGMGLAAADFHERPGPRGDAGDFVRVFVRGLGVAVFVEVFHRAPGAGWRGRDDRGGRRDACPTIFQLAQLLHLAEILEDLLRLRFIDAAEGKADVDDDVIADVGFGDVSEADFLEDAAEINFAGAHQGVFAADAGDFTWNSQTHCPKPTRSQAGGQ